MDDKRGGEAKRPGGEMHSPRTGETTRSQLLPIGANWSELPKKPYFLPGLAAVATVLLLFGFIGRSSGTFRVMYKGGLPIDVPVYSLVLATILSLGVGYAIYRMVGKRAAWWVMPVVAAFVGVIITTPVMGALQDVVGFGTSDIAQNDSFPIRFVKMFFLAGLPEELVKAIPVAIGVLIALKIKDRQSPMARLGVFEPLDAILIGAAAGIGFAFVETMLQYVPRTIAGGDANALKIFKTYTDLIPKIGAAHAAIEIQKLMPGHEIGLQLLIPRLLSGICGHAAYAGIFGYYIGLAFYKPANRAKTIAIGLAIAAGCHAAWNAAAGQTFGGVVVAVFSFALLMAVISKARELSPNRGELMASQLVDSLSRLYPGGVQAARPSAATGAAPGMASAAGAPAQQPRPAGNASMTWDDDSNLLTIEIGTARVPVTPGARLYERQTPGARSAQGDNIVAEVNANPNDPTMLGIKNLSNQAWQVTTEQGEERQLAPGRSVRLARGTRIQIGDLVAAVK